MDKFAYKKEFPNLFTPLTVGKGEGQVVFKNRILTGPFLSGPPQYDRDGVITKAGIDYYADYAKGGFANVVLPCEIPRDTAHPRSVPFEDYTQDGMQIIFSDLHGMQNVVHAYDCKTALSIYNAGAAQADMPGRVMYGASELEYQGRVCKSMDENDMEYMLGLFEKAAIMAVRAKFDYIMLDCGQGFLLHNFLSPLTNFRTDEYGGSAENRCRFPLRVIERIRKVVGDMPIELRFNGYDSLAGKEGTTLEDAAIQIEILQEGVDMFHLNTGHRRSSAARTDSVPTYFIPDAPHVKAAKYLREHVNLKIPMGIVGKVHDPVLAEQLLAEGTVDYIVMARQAIADPDYVKKIKENRREDIRPCLHCDYCMDGGRRDAKAKDVSMATLATWDQKCRVNPEWCFGIFKRDIPAPEASQKLSVIGGGVAGMAAAVTAARRGHQVTIYEKGDKLGGQLNSFVDGMSFKRDMKEYLQYLTTQVKKEDITVKLNTEATPEMVFAENPDAVFVAVGAKPVIPPIKGVESSNVYIGTDVLGKENELGERVVVIGGGLVGCELAIHLQQMGHAVTIVECADALAINAQLCERTDTLRMIEEAKINSKLGTTCKEITGKGVLLLEENGKETFLDAENVIISVGYRALTDLRDTFHDCAPVVRSLGDCKKARDLVAAIHEGYDAGMTLGV